MGDFVSNNPLIEIFCKYGGSEAFQDIVEGEEG